MKITVKVPHIGIEHEFHDINKATIWARSFDSNIIISRPQFMGMKDDDMIMTVMPPEKEIDA